MQEVKKELISIIIPCYNGEAFIKETLDSILAQSYSNFEIIVVDDGSNDESANIIKSYRDERIKYFYQNNAGVSIARNEGFQKSKGEFIVFFDADDLMTPNFLEVRMDFLDNNLLMDFCAGEIVFFPQKNAQACFGAIENIPKELLLYHPNRLSCPSNYMFKSTVLKKHKLTFNPLLSSTADRYFLMELSKVSKGGLVSDGALLYRVSPSSMSHKISEKLVLDNELFYKKLIEHELVPDELRKDFFFKINYILGGAFFQIKWFRKALYYTLIAFTSSPLKFIRNRILK